VFKETQGRLVLYLMPFQCSPAIRSIKLLSIKNAVVLLSGAVAFTGIKAFQAFNYLFNTFRATERAQNPYFQRQLSPVANEYV
jgi:hypothetical protein